MGLPITSGRLPVDAAKSSIIEPVSGMKPSAVGQLRSGWVDILRAVCDILRSVPKLLIGQRSIKAEHDYIGVFFNKIDTRSFEIAGQSLVAEKIDALAGAVSLEEVYSDMGRDYDALFVNGKAHLSELIPARGDIVRRVVREEIEVSPALADFF